MTKGFLIVGKAFSGKLKDEEVILGSFNRNNIYKNREEAEAAVLRAKEYYETVKYPMIDSETIRILTVSDEDGRINL